MAHKDDIRFLIKAPDGSWLSANIGGRSVIGEELRDIQKTVEGRGGASDDMPFGVAANDGRLPPPSTAKGQEQPWVPLVQRRRKRRRQ